MSNKDLFKRTFSQVCATEDRVKEIIHMTNKKKVINIKEVKKSVAKKALIIAACVGCALSALMIANAATDNGLSKIVIGWFVDANGEKSNLEADVSYDEYGNKMLTAVLENGVFAVTKDDNLIKFKYEQDNKTYEIPVPTEENLKIYGAHTNSDNNGEFEIAIVEEQLTDN